VYSEVSEFGFVDYDDPDYINTPQVRQGITREGLIWALSSREAANWFPVTRLSHTLDFQLPGVRSGLHHLTSVLFHALAALLLFAFLNRSTGALA
jgi:protein O-mannosyl-transferase